MAYVYILQSDKTSRYYIGSTNHLKQRIKQHLKGENKSTKSLLPLKIKSFQKYQTYSQARKIENKLKRKDYIDKIIQQGIIKLCPCSSADRARHS